MATFRSHLCMVKGPGELYFQTALNEQMPAKNFYLQELSVVGGRM